MRLKANWFVSAHPVIRRSEYRVRSDQNLVANHNRSLGCSDVNVRIERAIISDRQQAVVCEQAPLPHDVDTIPDDDIPTPLNLNSPAN